MAGARIMFGRAPSQLLPLSKRQRDLAEIAAFAMVDAQTHRMRVGIAAPQAVAYADAHGIGRDFRSFALP